MSYPDVDPQPDLPALEERSSTSGTRDGTFQASVEARPAGERRRQRVRVLRRPAVRQRPAALRPPPHRLREGRRAPLPDDAGPAGRAPLRLGLPRPAGRGRGRAPARPVRAARRSIEYGVATFNDACRTSVLRYTKEWERYVTRQARWVDFENDYKTLDLSYMESVMWAFKTLWDKGLVYEGYRVLPYCWRCETPLSQHRDPHGRRVPRPPGPGADRLVRARAAADRAGARILAWTTTPWTLPSQPRPRRRRRHRLRRGRATTAIAYVLAEAAPGRLRDASSAGDAASPPSRAATSSAAATTPLFPFFADQPNAFQVLAADFVTTEDGTGVVHLAPGFGEDDQNACDAAGIADGASRWTRTAASPPRSPPWAGRARVRRQPAR